MHRDNTYSVLLDTSFMIRLLSESDKLHQNALDYFKYFLANRTPIYISTIAIAEYCVRGDIEDLPRNNLRILPFNIMHARTAGDFTAIIWEARKEVEFGKRPVVLNDIKMFAQAHYEKISKFVTADSNSKKSYQKIKDKIPLNFDHLDIKTPVNEYFGLLDL